MDHEKTNDNPEDDMHYVYRRTDNAIMAIVILLAAVSIGVSIYGLIMFLILPVFGVSP